MARFSEVGGHKWQPGQVFVFGSNLDGRHGKGAARFAVLNCGAVHGCPSGIQGYAYAIPTKDANLLTLPLEEIKRRVGIFKIYARACPGLTFFVTAIGTGLAGYKHEQIAPMFADAPDNCILPPEWRKATVTP